MKNKPKFTDEELKLIEHITNMSVIKLVEPYSLIESIRDKIEKWRKK